MERKSSKGRVLIAKTTFDAHWRGISVVIFALRDAGFEVIYGGELTPDEIVTFAIQEDVDVLGLNTGTGIEYIVETVRKLRESGMDKMLVVAGGTIAQEDIPKLKESGVAEVFVPGSSLESITSFIEQNVECLR